MGQYIVDTNILSKFLRNELLAGGDRIVAEELNDGCTISFVTYVELKSWVTTTENEAKVDLIIGLTERIEPTADIQQQCIYLRRKHRLKIPDAFIAATAIQLNKTLLTNNTRDFANIAGLKLLDPTTY